VSAEKKVTFGVRKITTEVHEVHGWHGRRICINGQKILCRGGWVQPELLMHWDAERMDAEIRYYAEANLNLIYCCDVPNLPDAFLDACDRHGVMFGNCFYDDYPDFPKEACVFSDYTHFPQDMALLESCTVDVIKRYRNHPSLVMYLCMVERTPPEDVYEMWRRNIVGLDGTRWFIPSEYFPSDRKDAPEWTQKDLPTGMNDWVPKSYGWEEPVTYFQWVRDSRNWMFMMESGTASVPPISSLSKFLPNATAHSNGEMLFPLLPVWAHHGANSYYQPCDAALRRLYGEPDSVIDYCWKQHFVTADQNRAMFEAVNHRLWTITSGFTQWKINSCEPSIQWQIFDWYHKPMVSWFYIKKACESLHVQLNAPDHIVSVINTRLTAQPELEVRARVFDLTGRMLWEKTGRASVPANSYQETFAVPDPPDASSVYFVKLELKDAQGRPASDNFYWFPAKATAGCTALSSMPPAKLDATYKVEMRGAEKVARVKVTNPTSQIAVFVQLALTQGRGAEILPVIWEDNYFSLLPGETREVTARFAGRDVGDSQPVLEVGGWNIQTGYHCTAVKPSKASVKVGELFDVTAGVTETFLDGSRVILLVDGEPADSKWAWARGNKSDEVLFKLSLSKPGVHRLAVAKRETVVTVT
jgi:exo-1,4-beta-D-glucosaminidase